jgi:hypothetical protein
MTRRLVSSHAQTAATSPCLSIRPPPPAVSPRLTSVPRPSCPKTRSPPLSSYSSYLASPRCSTALCCSRSLPCAAGTTAPSRTWATSPSTRASGSPTPTPRARVDLYIVPQTAVPLPGYRGVPARGIARLWTRVAPRTAVGRAVPVLFTPVPHILSQTTGDPIILSQTTDLTLLSHVLSLTQRPQATPGLTS